jgi:hypothetical protein
MEEGADQAWTRGRPQRRWRARGPGQTRPHSKGESLPALVNFLKHTWAKKSSCSWHHFSAHRFREGSQVTAAQEVEVGYEVNLSSDTLKGAGGVEREGGRGAGQELTLPTRTESAPPGAAKAPHDHGGKPEHCGGTAPCASSLSHGSQPGDGCSLASTKSRLPNNQQ